MKNAEQAEEIASKLIRMSRELAILQAEASKILEGKGTALSVLGAASRRLASAAEILAREREDVPKGTSFPDNQVDLAARAMCLKKVRYRSTSEAMKVAVRRSRESGIGLRVYGCRLCGGFHLTKRSLEEFAGCSPTKSAT